MVRKGNQSQKLTKGKQGKVTKSKQLSVLSASCLICISSIRSWCWNHSLVAARRALPKQGERGRLGGHRVRGLRLHFRCGQVISLWTTVSHTIWNLCVLCRGN